jgi:hypothetical protein
MCHFRVGCHRAHKKYASHADTGGQPQPAPLASLHCIHEFEALGESYNGYSCNAAPLSTIFTMERRWKQPANVEMKETRVMIL